MDPNHCPADPEQIALDYCDGTLNKANATSFEDHCITCPRCTAEIEDAERYIRAITEAARQLRSGKATSGFAVN